MQWQKTFCSETFKEAVVQTEKRLNNCLLLHVHKETTDSPDLIEITRDFIDANDIYKAHFGSFQTVVWKLAVKYIW